MIYLVECQPLLRQPPYCFWYKTGLYAMRGSFTVIFRELRATGQAWKSTPKPTGAILAAFATPVPPEERPSIRLVSLGLR
jgi:hypothetical protein